MDSSTNHTAPLQSTNQSPDPVHCSPPQTKLRTRTDWTSPKACWDVNVCTANSRGLSVLQVFSLRPVRHAASLHPDHGRVLSAAEVQDICESLKEDSVRLLSVRGCQLADRDFGRVCRSVAESHSLAQLNLNLGVVSSISRTRHLADALKSNRSLQTLFLHGNPLLDAGLVTLNSALSTHPALVCLDLGDCMLGDEALGLICGMLPPDGAKSGLRSSH
ncbi:Leucine-rich repeat-containing protein 73 [Larimichthys crocea]|uniref:Leucine-rich repeat-containing protein 73 n=1 Tax=Larimichthys crocea TaxID=215358 RepID=A0A6G0HPC3_LARCR|nr:Leucine-rich repeat-containing protein 73 [Larimichthys crocea]